MACYCRARMPASLCLSAGAGAATLLLQRVSLGWQQLDATQFAQQGLAMTLAMTPALLYAPAQSLWRTGAPAKRTRVALCFVMAYVGVWFPASVLLMMTAFVLRALFGAERVLLLTLSVLIALAWNITPAKRHCLSVCSISVVLGFHATTLCGLRNGARQGLFCIGACWFVMLVPLLSGDQHLLMMGIATLILAFERHNALRYLCRRFADAHPGGGSEHRLSRRYRWQ
jgi:predicted metal-binding membrane protein